MMKKAMKFTRSKSAQLLAAIAVSGTLMGTASAEWAVTAAPAAAAPVPEAGEVLTRIQQLEKRVQDLLDRAVEHVKEKGLAGVNDFNNDARFTDKDLYVFSLSKEGVMLSSGGWSAGLVGDNVLSTTDLRGEHFFQKIIDRASRHGEGRVEYKWYNASDGTEEPKITYFKEVDDIIVAVGYFPLYATEEQALELLDLAVAEYQKNPLNALRKFRNAQSGYRNPDKYVFVLDSKERSVVLSPSDSKYVDQPLDEVKDVAGHAFLKEIVDTAVTDVVKTKDYWWFSNLTKKVELRRAYYKLVDADVIAVSTFVLQK